MKTGVFDAPDGEVQRLRAALAEIKQLLNEDRENDGAFQSWNHMQAWKVATEALSTTTEPTGAPREICPDHPDEKPQISNSHTWTQDGNTYFVSYVEYCPTCYRVISTNARL